MTQKVTVTNPFNFRQGADTFHFSKGDWEQGPSCTKKTIGPLAVQYGQKHGFITEQAAAEAPVDAQAKTK